MNWIKLSFKELVGKPSFVLFFVLNMTLGLSGLVLLENFKQTFEDHLQSRSKLLLGSDLSVGGRKRLSSDLSKKVAEKINAKKSTEMIDLFSMATSPQMSRLVYLNEFQKDFPYYGGLTLKTLGDSHQTSLADNEIFVYPELLIAFETQVGESLQIGSLSFTIKDVITDDSSQSFQMGSIAPKIYITRTGMSRAGLIKKGSTAFYTTYFQTDQILDETLVQQVINLIDDSALRVSTPKNASEQVGRMVNYLTDFLGLVSIVALALAIVGIFYLYRTYLADNRTSFAIFSSLGMTRREIFASQVGVLLLLSFLGTTGALLVSQALKPFIEWILSQALPFSLSLSNSLYSIWIGILVGTIGVLATSLPMAWQAIHQPISHLFQEGHESPPPLRSLHWLAYLPLGLFFYGLSCILSHSVRNGSLFFVALMLLIFLLFPTLSFVLNLISSKIRLKNSLHHLSLTYLSRYKISTISIFLSLFFGSLFVTFIPSLKAILDSELSGGLHGPTPSLFLFDIQDEQIPSLNEFIRQKDLHLLGLSPMIRARLTKINGQEIKIDSQTALTREGEREQRFRNRGVNITYSDHLSNQETLIQGEPLAPYKGQGLPQISLEFRYASRLDLKIGDRVTFDIMDVEQEAVVTSLRRVRWTSFQPNFFIVFPTGLLEDAPKTFLAAIPQMKLNEKIQFQTDLVKSFPNISAVDLDRLVTKIREILYQMSTALSAMSLFIVIVGLAVIFALVHFQIQARKSDLNLLKILGMNLPDIYKMITQEFFLIALFATLSGSLVGSLISYIFSLILFEGLWVFSFWTIFTPVTLISLTSAILSYLIARHALQKRAITYLS
ncbi:MAG: hypothetical protein KDD61_04080 [Bdellovibrionales bacterium]|nr:hypothetical protein [Bdellovibrionales bacterium]